MLNEDLLNTVMLVDVDFWSAYPENNNYGGMRFYWSSTQIGFGTVDIVRRDAKSRILDFNANTDNYDGIEVEFHGYTEYMDRTEEKIFLKRLFDLFLQKIKVID